jgi:hypothetical protein
VSTTHPARSGTAEVAPAVSHGGLPFDLHDAAAWQAAWGHAGCTHTMTLTPDGIATGPFDTAARLGAALIVVPFEAPDLINPAALAHDPALTEALAAAVGVRALTIRANGPHGVQVLLVVPNAHDETRTGH